MKLLPMLAVAQNVPRDEGRVTSLETKFRLLSSLGRIVLCLKCQSRDSGDSEWIQSSCITVAILDKSPLQGVSFEVVGVEKGNVATSHAKCRPLLAPPRLLRERLAQDPPATTVNPATSYRAPPGEPDRPARGFAGGSGRVFCPGGRWDRKSFGVTDLKGGRSGMEARRAGQVS